MNKTEYEKMQNRIKNFNIYDQQLLVYALIAIAEQQKRIADNLDLIISMGDEYHRPAVVITATE